MDTLTAYWNQIQTAVTEPSASFIFQACIAVLLLVLLYALLRRRQPSSIPAFDNDSGHIMVSRSAISELVQTACEQIPGVKRPKIRLRLKRGYLDLCVQLKLESNTRLRTISKTLQDHLSTALRENLGIEQLRSVNILVTGFKSGKLAPPAVVREAEEAAEKKLDKTAFVVDADGPDSDEEENLNSSQDDERFRDEDPDIEIEPDIDAPKKDPKP